VKISSSSLALPDGTSIALSAGGQNMLIKSIVEEFAQRYVRGPKILFLRDAVDKEIVADETSMAELRIVLPERGVAPDVIIHDTGRDWLFIIEAVTSHGPVDQKRKNELTELFADVRPGLVFVTAFPDRKTFARFHAAIAWETEVWIADAPDHMIHFNGERFLGPYA
jgi:adenine-specific DNA-methyltransferase